MAKIAILGFGTVGSGVYEVLCHNAASVSRRAGEPVEVKYILDPKDFTGNPVEPLVVKNIDVILQDPEIQVVVETIGGTRFAYPYVKACLESGRSVCTSNKEMVATYGAELLALAKEHGCAFLFEASVGGGIPIIDPLKHSLIANEITSVMGIVNGTTNYMLTRMADNGLSYEDEAYLFALQSGESRDVAFNTRLRALMLSGSQEATDFRAHTAQAGFQLADGAGSATKNTIAAIAKAYRLYKEYGPEQYVQILQLIADTWNGAAWSVTGYLLGGVAVFLREYGEEYSRSRFIKRLRSATYETLRDEARRQQRGSSDVAHALAVTKLYNLTGGRGTVDPRRLTVLD